MFISHSKHARAFTFDTHDSPDYRGQYRYESVKQRDQYPDILEYAIVNREGKGAGSLDKHEVARFVSDHDIICYMDEWYIFSEGKIYRKIPVDVINELIYTNLKKYPGCPFPSRTSDRSRSQSSTRRTLKTSSKYPIY